MAPQAVNILFTIQTSWTGPFNRFGAVTSSRHLVHHPHKADGVRLAQRHWFVCFPATDCGGYTSLRVDRSVCNPRASDGETTGRR